MQAANVLATAVVYNGPYARQTTEVAGLVQLLGHAADGWPAERLIAGGHAHQQ